MNRTVPFASVSVFSIFLGSQITEGCLLVPYWKTLPKTEFYDYYSKFGPSIGKFYTILTIIAMLIPLCISIYCFFKKAQALRYSLLSTFFAFLVIVIFYGYFKDTNQQFYEATFNANQLRSVLAHWEYWHWLRVLFELVSLIFLLLAFTSLTKKTKRKTRLNP